MQELPAIWAGRFGLALAPLFNPKEIEEPDAHHVLLDGGYGSFALSVGDADQWSTSDVGSWAWSSNLAHHVAVSKDRVSVSRWDKPEPEVLSLSSVERRIDAFYDYLVADRVRSSRRVVDHLIDVFRRVRSLVSEAGVPDEKATDAYLAFLEVMSDRDRLQALGAPRVQFSSEGEEVLRRFSPSSITSLVSHAMASEVLSRSIYLYPGLAVRHAGSEVFQEAHFELIRSPVPDLFGYVGPAETKSTSRGGAHFTPPALARSVCEQTLRELGDLSARRSLTILDPACGSGAFLHEATRALQRLGFDGELKLIGRDISGAAVSMAAFVLRHAELDWRPSGGIQTDLKVSDSLAEALPNADVVLMNPPFVSWAALSGEQRQQMRDVLDTDMVGRGDLSMAFVSKAMLSLSPGGVLGALLPSSLLSLQAAEPWRASLLEKSALRFVAALGDHGLFAHALVSVAAMVLRLRSPDEHVLPVTALVTANTTEATGEALRALRRDDPAVSGTVRTANWRLFTLAESLFEQRPTWRLTSPETEAVITRVLEGGARRLEELFDVRQGVRTGSNTAFLLSVEELKRLPKKEQLFFKPAVVNDSIRAGRMVSEHFVFYPHTSDGDLFSSEEELKKALPEYYTSYLLPNRTALLKRSSISGSGRDDWWGLSRKRSWALAKSPRIVSKYFGGPGGFAADITADTVIVQGHAWLPKWVVSSDDEDIDASVDETLLYAYAALMNSNGFGSIIEAFSPHVAGGQFDLSPRYVNAIPIPDLPALASDERAGGMVARLAEFGRSMDLENGSWRAHVERLVADLYGGPLTAEF